MCTVKAEKSNRNIQQRTLLGFINVNLLLCGSRKYPYLPITPLEIPSYGSLNFLVLQNPHTSGNSNPFCGEIMDIF